MMAGVYAWDIFTGSEIWRGALFSLDLMQFNSLLPLDPSYCDILIYNQITAH